MSDTQGYFGFQGLSDDNGPYNKATFAARQELQRVRTHVAVKIVAVHGGGVGPPPTVDVMPLVNMIDGQGNMTPHGTIYGIPCTRPQAGAFTIIHDPVVGDIGHISIHDRDISSLKSNNGQQSNPGSFRRHDVADGVYSGQILNQTTPTDYIQAVPGGGIKIVTSKPININGLMIDSNGNLTTPGGITGGFGTADSVTLQKHIHEGTPPPTPGT